MRFSIVLLAALTVVYGEKSTLFLYEELPVQFKDFIPENVRIFYTTLNVAEKKLLKEFATKTGDFVAKTDAQAWDLLKTKNVELYQKTEDIRTQFEIKFEKLLPETKIFVNWLFEKLHTIYQVKEKIQLQEASKQIINRYQNLKEDAKLDLKKFFPWIFEYIQHEKFIEVSNGIFRN